MKPAVIGSVIPQGELAVRILANYSRLEGKWYRPDEVFSADQHGWPGDWEGRLLLALALHARSTGRQPAWLEEILERIPAHLNQAGYFGAVLPAGKNDEQQMAGHSWYLRGLLECRALGYGAQVDPLIHTVVENLLLPSTGNYARYPLDPGTRWESPHWKLSQLQKKRSTHAETSDCGCAFIMLDGASAWYEASADERAGALIDEMIARYREIDFEGLHVQTHATLSALRGILRMYRLRGDRRLLTLVKKVFTLYKEKAWTAAYGNYNWFGLPRWTEPCAIVDSFLLALQLWQADGDARWLNDAHHIYQNALSFAQRATGAFGTDTCAGPAGRVLEPITYEVVWCCTMRGAEALSCAVCSSFFQDGSDLYFPLYQTCRAHITTGSGELTLREHADFAARGTVSFTVEHSSLLSEIGLRFFIPPGCGPAVQVRLNGRRTSTKRRGGFAALALLPRTGDRIEVSFPLKLTTVPVPAVGGGGAGKLFLLGPSILGLSAPGPSPRRARTALPYHHEEGYYTLGKNGKRLRTLGDITAMTQEDTKVQIIF